MPRHLFFLKDPSLLAADTPVEGDGTSTLAQVPEWVNVLPEPESVNNELVIYSRDGRVLHVDSMEKLAKRSNAALKKQKGGGLVDADHSSVFWGGPAIAWAEAFEYRPGKGMWAQADWLAAGEQLVGSKQYRYTSSVVSGDVKAEVDEETWGVTWHIYPNTVDGFAVTNIPALVTTSMFSERPAELEREAILTVLLAKLGVDSKNPTMPAVKEAFGRLFAFTSSGEAGGAGDNPPQNLEKPTTPPEGELPPPLGEEEATAGAGDEAPAPLPPEVQAELASARQQIAELSKAAAVAYVDSLLSAGKITPAMKPGALDLASTTEGLAKLRGLYHNAPAILPASAAASAPAKHPADAPHGVDPLAYQLARQGVPAHEIVARLKQRAKETAR